MIPYTRYGTYLGNDEIKKQSVSVGRILNRDSLLVPPTLPGALKRLLLPTIMKL